jgi:UDP:flavonoid glycosyltransferase YjiC (YdhE family)
MAISSSSLKARSVAIICLMPDYGHAQPLLKIADALAEAGFEIKCYIADECAPLMDRFQFNYMLLESGSLSKAKKTLAKIFRRSLFLNAVCSYIFFLFLYPNVAQAVCRSLEKMKAELAEQRPDIIICDLHWFADWYMRIAVFFGIPLIINVLDGSLLYNQRTFVRTYGISTFPPSLQRAVEFASAIARKFCTNYSRIRYFSKWFKVRAASRATEIAFTKVFFDPKAAQVPVGRIVVGGAAIERDRLGKLVQTEGANWQEFFPIRFRSRLPLAADLGEWIKRSMDDPIVYVSFGSAVEIDRAFSVAIYEGLRHLGTKVLWSLPTQQQGLLSALPPAENIRIESFVPQPEILEISAVRCFITHAGTYSLQDAFLGGTPMLCIPFFADQAYNSSVVKHLHVGERLWRRHVSPRSIETAVQSLLSDDRYLRSALELRDDLLQRDGGALVANYIREFIELAGQTRETTRPDLPHAHASH